MRDDEAGSFWPRNAAGETYGSGVADLSGRLRPDLISVGLRDGKRGYVRRTELEAARGAGLPPAERVEWRMRAGARAPIPIYEQDGVTVIGTFVVGSI